MLRVPYVRYCTLISHDCSLGPRLQLDFPKLELQLASAGASKLGCEQLQSHCARKASMRCKRKQEKAQNSSL